MHHEKCLQQPGVLDLAAAHCVVLLNVQGPAESAWAGLPAALQEQIIAEQMRPHCIDAFQLARQTEMGTRINTIMQTYFFALSGIMLKDQAIQKIKRYLKKTYCKKGLDTVERNYHAVNETLAHLVDIPLGAVTAEAGAAPDRLAVAPTPVHIQPALKAQYPDRGGDDGAYDIGYGGLDHVLASGPDDKILVINTELYSNIGGQISKATPLGAVAKCSAGEKPVGKKDLALQAIAYGNVYVARVAFGANPQQMIQVCREAEAFPGPSIILAYSQCIAHGIDMAEGLSQQKLAVTSGHWPLLRFNPLLRKSGTNPFILGCLRPSVALAQEALALRWATYEELATRAANDFQPVYR